MMYFFKDFEDQKMLQNQSVCGTLVFVEYFQGEKKKTNIIQNNSNFKHVFGQFFKTMAIISLRPRLRRF